MAGSRGHGPASAHGHADRPGLLRQSLRLSWITLGWALVEGVAGLTLAWRTASVALLGFGLDCLLEGASSAVIVWRNLGEQRATGLAEVERLERKAGRLVAVGLALLAAYIAYQAASDLLAGGRAAESGGGAVLAAASMGVTWWLARRKRTVAYALGSRAIEADAFQAQACFYLAAIVLVGTGLHALLGWWWADPAAALLMLVPLGQEAVRSWSGVHDH